MDKYIQKPRIIRASAGTGKTYRLSLEFIALLIKFKDDLTFDQIVVITFTRKATYEIRQRIIIFLKNIALKQNNHNNLEESLRDLYPEIDVNDNTRTYLKDVYQQIITQKSLLNISTLDSFINQIFRNLIVPYYNISEYDIDPHYNVNLLPEIYEELLSKQHYQALNHVFINTRDRELSKYDSFITDIIENRWLFEFYRLANVQDLDVELLEPDAYDKLQIAAGRLIDKFTSIIVNKYPDTPLSKLFPKAWYELIESHFDSALPAASEIDSILKKLLADKDFLRRLEPLIDKNIYNGSSLLRGKANEADKVLMQELQADFAEKWYNYAFVTMAIPEQNAIIKTAELIFEKYDQLKLRSKIFTYSDIATYTWKYLYNDDISIIENGEVINIFYEQLAYQIRFILIDEFQDTSILQWNIFSPLIKELVAGSGISQQNSMVIVGDEKQAIYGWRSGERNLLKNMENIIISDYEDISPLTVSYRSSKKVIELVNRLFSNQDIFLSATDDLQWEYQNITAANTTEGYCDLQITNRSRDKNTLSFKDIVSEYIVNTLKPALEDGLIAHADTTILTRTGNDAQTICSALRENGIDFIAESSKTIIEHRAIQPLIFLLKWLNNLDIYHLVAFLRSDLILMKSADLKNILNLYREDDDKKAFYLRFYDNYKDLPAVKALKNLHELRDDPYNLIKNAIREFAVIKIFDHETDYINIQKFLDIVSNFTNQLDYPQTINGLLLYFEEKKDSELFNQAAIKKQSAIKVMSIHKSKGLEFDTVVLILNSDSGSRNSKKLSIYPLFEENYSALKSAFITYNYSKFLQHSSYNEPYKIATKKEYVEDINVWYVALTRPKRNLMMLYSYKSKKDLDTYLNDYNNDMLRVNKLMLKTMVEEFADESLQNAYSSHITLGKLDKYQEKDEVSMDIRAADNDVSAWFEPRDKADLAKKENWKKSLDQVFMQRQTTAKLIGNIAHYYLQQIEFDSAESRSYALKKTREYYGSLAAVDKIQALSVKLELFLDNNSQYFSSDNWDSALREFVIFDKKQNEYRIDRLLVSHKRKEILVLDYKTGSITDAEQLERYQKILADIPFVKNNKYLVLTGRYLKIDLK